MAPSVPTTAPSVLTAGASWQWDPSFSDFPASDGWQLSYLVRGPEDLDIVWGTHVSASGDGFEVRVPPAKTDLAAGLYTLTPKLTDGTDSFFLDPIGLAVRANPGNVVNSQSHDEEMVSLIEDALKNRVVDGRAVITILGDEERWIAVEDLQEMLGRYRARVTMARNGGRLQKRRVVFRRA